MAPNPRSSPLVPSVFTIQLPPSGIWAIPNPEWLCAVAGGYAYLIHAIDPAEFKMLEYRPVLQVMPLPDFGLILFVGHHSILAWNDLGEAWQSDRLSSEGISTLRIEGETLHGVGWDMMTDKDLPFRIDVINGQRQ